MAVANEHLPAIFNGTYRPGRTETVSGNRPGAGFAQIQSGVRSGLLDALDVSPRESRLEVEQAGQGGNPTAGADVVVAGMDMIHRGRPEQVAAELLKACRPGGRIGLACPVPGSFLAAVHARIEAYTAREGRTQRRGFTGTRQALNALFGASAIALGACEKSLTLRFASLEHWLAEWRACYAPLKQAYQEIDPEWRGQFTSDLLSLAGSFAEVNDGMLSMRSDYLEFIVHKANLQ